MVNQLSWHKFLSTDFHYLELHESIYIWHACRHGSMTNPYNSKLQYFQMVTPSLLYVQSDSFYDDMDYYDTFLIFDLFDQLIRLVRLFVRYFVHLELSDLCFGVRKIKGMLVILVVLKNVKINRFLRVFCNFLAEKIYI